MLQHASTRRQLAASLFIAANLSPAAIVVFEATMVSHMLVQLPLLCISGALIARDNPALQRWLLRLDRGGAIALVIGSGWLFFWMLPVNLDLATLDYRYRLLKVLSVPLAIGLCLFWAWCRSSALLKLVLLFEAWASITRLGWLYIESPVQLCSRYLLSEQLLTGRLLLAASALLAGAALAWGLFGSFARTRAVQ